MKLIAEWKKFHRMWSFASARLPLLYGVYLLASPMETALVVLNQILRYAAYFVCGRTCSFW